MILFGEKMYKNIWCKVIDTFCANMENSSKTPKSKSIGLHSKKAKFNGTGNHKIHIQIEGHKAGTRQMFTFSIPKPQNFLLSFCYGGELVMV